ncbi:DUF397 domain-containing protein [Yinghuangia soli]|uniref:DUF397 domain-containing protein n=1 Tax=Yinghuangia soli TaxID=2908204 RepID=A0AA41U2B1_9ACTN|nr:DUF397 domain-containing protein [Yinghuangia soli]MCF2526934.1 DUF397 domain-containing protein [Yinghuangia soli]
MGSVGVLDSKRPDGPVIEINRAAWSTLILGLQGPRP